jgi:hypothetical protein
MSRRYIIWRAQIAASTVAIAQPRIVKIIRFFAQRRIYAYAKKNRIITFEDVDFVQQFHRDWKETLRVRVQSLIADTQAATTIAELLVVFDQLEPWLE